MCGIAGIVSKNETRAGPFLEKMLFSMQHRGPDGAGFIIGDQVERKNRLKELNFKGKNGNIALGHVRLAITGSITGIQPFQSASQKITLLHNGEIYNYQELQKAFPNQLGFNTNTDSEVILGLVEKFYTGDLTEAVIKTLHMLDGVYALAITDNKQVVIARDKIGVRQLYYYKDEEYVGFSSEKKPLMAITEYWEKIERLLPGHIAVLDKDGLNNFAFWDPSQIKPETHITNKDEALNLYFRSIHESIHKRVVNRKRVGIIFSGGIDSLLIAYIIKKMGVPFTCYTAGYEDGASDIEWAIFLAEKFNFPLQVKRLSVGDIENLIPEIIKDIEDYSLNQVEVAVPIYAAVRMAQENAERVILTGQGADELFGGYPWYSKIVDQEGYNHFERRSWEDTFLLYKECLEREDKISMAHSLELRVPYLDMEIIKTAFRIAPQLKIHRKEDTLMKRIHREFCLSIGIPEEIAFRKKEAAQHGANVHHVFERLAQKQGLDEFSLEIAGYDPGCNGAEILGSSSRYGFRYGDHHLWKISSHVQYYLDTQASQLDLLPPENKKYWEKITSRLTRSI